MNQLEKAAHFASLHAEDDPLVLYNIWDAGGAKTLEQAGAKAIATGSWSVAAAHGFDDGEIMPLAFVLQIVERIAETIDLPLTVDFEGGYATDPDGVFENVRQIIRAGAVGINFEDQVMHGDSLYPVAAQFERIKAARAAANQENIPLFINARTDVFLRSDSARHASLMAQAIERESAYAEAGADGFFIPGLTQIPLIQQMVDAASLPINVMMKGDWASLSDIQAIRVSRVSYGPGPYLAAMLDLSERYRSIRQA
ncbi:MAG: isocitrate lyase/phosphoenolpyruvate mutase family protein [Pseudomonadota bacterium]